MPHYIASLNSGSNGNCYYVGNDVEAVLIDAGISCRETERRLIRCGLSIEKVKAIFISHEHIDHIRGVEVLAKKYRLPVYITKETLKYSGLILEECLVKNFRADESIRIGGICVTPFSKMHDASDPFSFTVETNGKTTGVFTDIGSCCENVIRNFKLCDAIFLEANYDDEMLDKGAYPYYLKKRISGDRGHLSNAQALELFKNHKPDFMSHVLLSHLSKDNNNPDLVKELFEQHAGESFITVASRYEESEVYKIGSGFEKSSSRKIRKSEGSQTSLF